jgi:hypothetical protein
MASDRITKDLKAVDKARAERAKIKSDERSIRNEARDNARGKTKPSRLPPLGRALNHKKPKNFTRQNPTFTNPMASLGYTDEQYIEYTKTGKTKAQQISEQEGN